MVEHTDDNRQAGHDNLVYGSSRCNAKLVVLFIIFLTKINKSDLSLSRSKEGGRTAGSLGHLALNHSSPVLTCLGTVKERIYQLLPCVQGNRKKIKWLGD